MTHVYRIGATLTALLAAASPLAAQTVWSSLPALPNACYTKGESFAADAERALASLQERLDRQEAINAAIQAQMTNLSMGEQQTRMIAFLQRDPVAGQRYMQNVSTAGTEVQERTTALSSQRVVLNDRWNEARAKFEEERKPVWALHGKAQSAWHGEHGVPANPTLGRRLSAEHNTAYEAYCNKWLRSPTSPLLSYLADLKTLLIEEEIPLGERMTESARLSYQVMSIPATGFRSTEPLKAAKEYLDAARKAFEPRLDEPLRTATAS